ncbi:lysosomal proton-coupled steroid conjugate and bile acid symporter SLC46A3-like [Saccostrea cucullata]|uniref:lysosomal proton-coupled steroid conjugate and bile acid symporter SLC46A3-like n=1 Tax=Saccostrea cuccullata TaxID=36930 RepID=UPI002ED316E8
MDVKETIFNKQEIRPAKPTVTWRHYLAGPILLLHLFASTVSLNTVGLYVPMFISKKLYPMRTIPISTGSICTDNETEASPESQAIQKEAAEFNTYVSLVSGIPAIISNLLLGTLSDRFGRIFLFLTPAIGEFINKTVELFCIYYNLDINYILIGSTIEGLMGGYLALMSASFSYIADMTENNKQRSVAIVFLEMSIGIGVVAARFSTGYFIQATDYIWPQLTACCIYALLILVIVFVLPETRTPKSDSKLLSKTSCLNQIGTTFSFYISKTYKGERWKYNTCMFIFFTTGINVFGKVAVDTLYQISQPFCWGSVQVGLYGALTGLFQNVICMGMIKVLHLCLSDEGVSILGSISGIAGFMVTAFASTDLMLYLAAIAGGGGVLTLPMVTAIMSRITPQDKQGALFGGIAATETVCGILGNLVLNSIYANTVSFFRGTVYLVMAGFVLISLVLLV